MLMHTCMHALELITYAYTNLVSVMSNLSNSDPNIMTDPMIIFSHGQTNCLIKIKYGWTLNY